MKIQSYWFFFRFINQTAFVQSVQRAPWRRFTLVYLCKSYANSLQLQCLFLESLAKSNQHETIFWLSAASGGNEEPLKLKLKINSRVKLLLRLETSRSNRKVSRTPARRAKIIYIIPPCASLLRSEMNKQTTTLNSIAWVLQLNNWEANWTKKYKFMPSRLASWISTYNFFARRVSLRIEMEVSFFFNSRHIF